MLQSCPQVLGGSRASVQGTRVPLSAARGPARGRVSHTSRAIAEPPAKPAPSAMPGANGSSASHASNEIVNKLKYQFGKQANYNAKDAYHGTAWSVRERLIDAFDKTHEHWK